MSKGADRPYIAHKGQRTYKGQQIEMTNGKGKSTSKGKQQNQLEEESHQPRGKNGKQVRCTCVGRGAWALAHLTGQPQNKPPRCAKFNLAMHACRKPPSELKSGRKKGASR